MHCGLIDARINGRGVDVDPIKLVENVRLILDRDPADLNPVLASVGQRCLMPEEEESARLRLDAGICALRLYADDRPEIIRSNPPLKKAFLGLDVVKKLASDNCCVEGFLIKAEINVVLLRVG